MNDNQLDDLKQFITATASQTEARLEDKINELDTKLSGRIDGLSIKVEKLESKIDDVDAKADAILEAVGERFDHHEDRITKLETAHTIA